MIQLFPIETPQQACSSFYNIINKSITKFVSRIKLKIYKNALISKSSNRLYNKLRRTWFIWRKTGSLSFLQKYKRIKKLLRKSIKRTRDPYKSRLIKSDNPKLLFKQIKNLYSSNSSTISLISNNGQLISDKFNISIALNKYFISCLNPKTINSVKYKPSFASDSSLNITVDMVERHIKKSKTSNSCGTDRIPITYWKVLSTVLAAPISLLFNMFLRTGYNPWIWKQSLIIPLLKAKSVKTNLASYRPISLTCSLSKIIEKMHTRTITKTNRA